MFTKGVGKIIYDATAPFYSEAIPVVVRLLSPGWIGCGHILQRISRTELVKAVNIWSIEEGRVRRMLLLPAIGRAAGEKEH